MKKNFPINELRLPWSIDIDLWNEVTILDKEGTKVGSAESLLIAELIIASVNSYEP